MTAEEQIKQILTEALEDLRVSSANRIHHLYRWSYTDLATDLAPLILGKIGGVDCTGKTLCEKCSKEIVEEKHATS